MEREFPVLTKSQLRRLSMIGEYGYFERAVANLLDNICPFCYLSTCREVPIKETDGWIAKWNDFPQKKKTAKHLLVIPRRHIVEISEMTLDDWAQSGHLIQWVIFEYDIPGGGILTRFGDPFLNAGTVEHFHINIMEPNGLRTCHLPRSSSSKAGTLKFLNHKRKQDAGAFICSGVIFLYTVRMKKQVIKILFLPFAEAVEPRF